MEYDDVMNKRDRCDLIKKKERFLFGDHLKYDIVNMIYDTGASIVTQTKATGNYKDFEFEIIKHFTMDAPVTEAEFASTQIPALTDIVFKKAKEDYDARLNLLKEK